MPAPRFLVEPLEGRTLLSTVLPDFSESIVATGIASPTAMAFAPDGRLFVAQQGGQLRVVQNGTLLSTPFVTVPTSPNGERGLLGVTFDPNFSANGYVYVYYTVNAPQVHNRLSRFTASGNAAVAGSEQVLLELDNLSSATNHNGGALKFGKDGKLYVAVGENARSTEAQSLNSLHGKILRLNANGSIPTDNPFYNSTTGNNRAIWAYGLRNPYTFDVQPGTGTIYLNDVGQNTWEEINLGVAGANYGWPTTEGVTTDPRFVSPLYAYNHSTGAVTGLAITGAAFYNPSTTQFPSSYVGGFFFADYVSGWIKMYRGTASGPQVSSFADGVGAPVDLEVGPDGALYYLARGNGGQVGRIAYAPQLPPTIIAQPASQTVTVGKPVTFTVGASGQGPFTYQWQRNGANVSGATGSSYTIGSAQASDNGATFRAIVSNANGPTTSNGAKLTVTSNQAPTATITAPVAGFKFTAGQALSFAGAANDAEDGMPPAGAFTWTIDYYTGDSPPRPFYPATSGIKQGSVTIPKVTPYTSADVKYRITLSVKDSAGLTTTTFRDVLPVTARVTLAATGAIAGVTGTEKFKLNLDGTPFDTAYAFVGVAGFERTLSAPARQVVNGVTYDFVGWSDASTASTTRTIATPSADRTFTAVYAPYFPVNTGLRGMYFDNRDFTGPSVVRRDATVNFNWARTAPLPPIAADTFGVRWTGQIRPTVSQTYAFHTTSDDGVRLWVNGQQIINNFTDHSATENTGSIALQAGRLYDLRLDYYENTGDATMRLSWSGPSTPKQVVPASAFYLPGATLDTAYASTDVGATPAGSTTTVAASVAYDVRGGGPNILGTADGFRFVHRKLTGDFDMKVRVDSLTAWHTHAKAGLMARASLDADSREVSLVATPSQLLGLVRSTTGGETTVTTRSTSISYPNVWLRLHRVGNAIYTYFGADGVTWSAPQVSNGVLTSDTLYVGMAVSSRTTDSLATGRFRQLSV